MDQVQDQDQAQVLAPTITATRSLKDASKTRFPFGYDGRVLLLLCPANCTIVGVGATVQLLSHKRVVILTEWNASLQLTGFEGAFCSPRCNGNTCPRAPIDASAQPSCNIEGDSGDRCSLLCNTDSECPGASQCRSSDSGGATRICLYDESAPTRYYQSPYQQQCQIDEESITVSHH